MVKYKIGIKFDKKFLNTLKENENSGVEIQKRKHHLALHPIHLNDFSKSLKDLLNEGVAKYSKNLGGILLGYQNIKLPVDIGYINNDSCYIHIDIEADFFIFNPEIGKELTGIVNRRSKDHVGLLVYKAFNVSIPKPQDGSNWLGSSINIGDEVLFRIIFINLESYLPYIRGEIISILTHTEGTGKNKRVNKKIKFDEEPDLKTETPGLKKSKKHRKNIEESIEENQNNEKQHSSKKRKKIVEQGGKSPEAKQSKKKEINRDHNEVSLENLNLSKLFSESQVALTSHSPKKKKKAKSDTKLDNTSSEVENKKSRKRSHSGSNLETPPTKKHKKDNY